MADTPTVGLLVTMEAKPGRERDVEEFLDSGLTLVNDEPATTAWFAIHLGGSTYGIFDVFPDDAGRDAHLAAVLWGGSGSNRRPDRSEVRYFGALAGSPR